jgi:hypothetical protein
MNEKHLIKRHIENIRLVDKRIEIEKNYQKFLIGFTIALAIYVVFFL